MEVPCCFQALCHGGGKALSFGVAKRNRTRHGNDHIDSTGSTTRFKSVELREEHKLCPLIDTEKWLPRKWILCQDSKSYKRKEILTDLMTFEVDIHAKLTFKELKASSSHSFSDPRNASPLLLSYPPPLGSSCILGYVHARSGTPWVIGGGMATVYPFLFFRRPKVKYLRRWLVVSTKHTPSLGPTTGQREGVGERDVVERNVDQGSDSPKERVSAGGDAGLKGEEEAIALDLALPDEGLDRTKPFYVVLHGLNGGSDEVRRECGLV